MTLDCEFGRVQQGWLRARHHNSTEEGSYLGLAARQAGQPQEVSTTRFRSSRRHKTGVDESSNAARASRPERGCN